MKHRLGHWAAGLAVATLGSALLLGPSWGQPNPEEIFIPADTDSFDPGLPVGAQFPPIRALYEGREITDVDQFMGDRGAVFFANRSVDW